MSNYFIGDVHGCFKNLRSMLDLVCFDPNVDTLYLTGDLIARGPSSLEVLRLIYTFNTSARLVLGNHELHLLKIYLRKNYKKNKNCFDTILNAPDLEELMYWLLHQPILHIDENKKILMTHAGINLRWNIEDTKKYAKEIEEILVSDYPLLLFQDAHENISNTNCAHIQNLKQIQENVNIFTRMRYIDLYGQLNLKYKGLPKEAPKNAYPWFSLRRSLDPTYNIIFGHWASLKNTKIPSGIYGLDSGCCWGGALTLLRWEDKKIISIPCIPPA